MWYILPMIGVTLLLLGGCAGKGTEQRDAVPAAVADGKAQSCIPLTQIRETRVRSDSVIDFVMTGGRVYRNTLPYACPNLGFERRFGYATSLSQLCSTDVIAVLHETPAGPGAHCGLGAFQPVKLAPARPAL